MERLQFTNKIPALIFIYIGSYT